MERSGQWRQAAEEARHGGDKGSGSEDDRHRPCDVEHALCAVKHRRNGHAHRQRDEQKGQVRPRSDMSSDEQCKTGKGRGEKADSAAREARFGRAMQSKAQRLEQRRSEEHTSELQSLMRISYDVFCLKNKKKQTEK